MSTKARIIMPNCILEAEFFDTPCAAAVVSSLPITARPDEWGDEFYFTVPVDMPLDETATEQVTVGGYRLLAAREGAGDLLRTDPSQHRKGSGSRERGEPGRENHRRRGRSSELQGSANDTD